MHHTIDAVAVSKSFMSDALDQIVLAGDPDHGIFRSTDRGDTWVQTDVTSTAVNALSFATTATAESSGTVFAGTNNGVLKSTNGGLTWDKVGSGLDTTVTSLAVSPNYLTDKVVFAGTPVGVFESADGGQHWSRLGDALASVNTLALTPDFNGMNNTSMTGSLFAGTESGVFIYTFSGSGSTTTTSTTISPTTSTTTSGGGGGTTSTTVPATTSTTVAGTSTIPLVDVKDSDWFAPCIRTLVLKGVINGYPNHEFRPNIGITRAEFAKVIILAVGEQPSTTETAFSDVDDNWAKGFIQRASELGIITGYPDGTFKPEQLITRQEIAVMIVKAGKFGEAETFVSEFPDVPSSLWSWPFIEKAADLDIVKGFTDGMFRPTAFATRAEACSMVCNMLQQL